MRKGYVTAAWAALYSIVCLFWTLRGTGFPAGTGDTDGSLSPIRNISQDVLAPVFAIVMLAIAVMAFAISGPHAARLRGLPRAALLGFGWLAVTGLLFAVPDVRLLAVTGYAPMLIFAAPFGMFDGKIDYAQLFAPSLLNQVWCVIGGVLLASTLLAWQRRDRGPAYDERIIRWGRWATYIAAIIPVLYALTRFAWVLGIPLGLTDAGLQELTSSGAIWAGFGLAAFAVVGAILTLGLVQRWGEVFPRWMIGLAGRRVPIRLATVPATIVAIFVMQASISLLTPTGAPAQDMADGSVAIAPMMLWPLWSVALGLAALGYQRRRSTV